MDLELFVLSYLLGLFLRFFLSQFQGISKTTPILLGIWEGVALYQRTSSFSTKRPITTSFIPYIPTLLSIATDLILNENNNGLARAGLVLMWAALSAVASSALSGRHWYDTNVERRVRRKSRRRIERRREEPSRPQERQQRVQFDLDERGLPPRQLPRTNPTRPPPPPPPPLLRLAPSGSTTLDCQDQAENGSGWPALSDTQDYTAVWGHSLSPDPLQVPPPSRPHGPHQHENPPIFINDSPDENDSAGLGLGVDSEELEEAVRHLDTTAIIEQDHNPPIPSESRGWEEYAHEEPSAYHDQYDSDTVLTAVENDRLSTIPEESGEDYASTIYAEGRRSALEVERPIAPIPSQHVEAPNPRTLPETLPEDDDELEYVDNEDDLLQTPLGLAPGVILNDADEEADLLRTPTLMSQNIRNSSYSRISLWDEQDEDDSGDTLRNPLSPIRILEPN